MSQKVLEDRQGPMCTQISNKREQVVHLRLSVGTYMETLLVIILNIGLNSVVPGVQARRKTNPSIMACVTYIV